MAAKLTTKQRDLQYPKIMICIAKKILPQYCGRINMFV